MKTAEEIMDVICGTTQYLDRYSVIKAINEARKEAAIEFFKWNTRKVHTYLEYIQVVKPLVKSHEIEEALNEFEGATIEERYKPIYQ